MGNKLYQSLVRAAQDQGIPLFGGVDIEKASQNFEDHIEFYSSWLSKGFQAEMDYLTRGERIRRDPSILVEGVKSVFSVAVPYRVRSLPDDKRLPKIARYIYGVETGEHDQSDYHKALKATLRKMMDQVVDDLSDDIKFRYKVCVDTSAVTERSWAQLSGLGWIGKNKMLIHPQFGSYLILGEVLLDHELDESPKLMKDYCGKCNRCLEGCPTRAIDIHTGVDSRKCVSYLTLEKRTSSDLSHETAGKIGNWIAGCDVCQEVCPFNTKPVKTDSSIVSTPSWLELFEWSAKDELYQKNIKPTAANRMKRNQLLRNVLIAFINAFEAGIELEVEELRKIAIMLRDLDSSSDRFPKEEWRACLHLLD